MVLDLKTRYQPVPLSWVGSQPAKRCYLSLPSLWQIYELTEPRYSFCILLTYY